MNAAHEGSVKGAHSVRRDDNAPAVILQSTQEDGHEAVVANVTGATTLEVDVSHVKQDEGAVALAEFEEVAEVVLDADRINAEIARGEGDEGTAGELGDALGGTGLAGAGLVVEEEDAALALVLDEVIAPGGDFAFGTGGEAADEGLDGELDLVDDEGLEGLLVGLEGLEMLDIEVSPASASEDEAGYGVAQEHIEQVTVRRRVLQGVQILKSDVGGRIGPRRPVLGADLAATTRGTPGQMIFGGGGTDIAGRATRPEGVGTTRFGARLRYLSKPEASQMTRPDMNPVGPLAFLVPG